MCYDLVHQIRCAKHTFSGRCDITPMVCCSSVHSTPQFLQCINSITRSLHINPSLKYDVTGVNDLHVNLSPNTFFVNFNLVSILA